MVNSQGHRVTGGTRGEKDWEQGAMRGLERNLRKWFITSIKNIYFQLILENLRNHNAFHLKSSPLSFPN